MLTLALHAALLFINASEKPNLAIVDLVSEGLAPQERQDVLKSLRKEFQWQSVYEVLREEDIERILVKTDPLQEDYQRELQRHQASYAELEAQIRQARLYYSESRFEEALSLLESAWYLASSSSLALEPESIQTLLSYRAACQFFLGKVPEAKESLRALLFVFPSFNLGSAQFPPNLLQLQNEVRKDHLEMRDIFIRTNAPAVSVRFLGTTLPQGGAGSELRLSIPKNLEILAVQSIVVAASGYQPQQLELSNLSETQSLELPAYAQKNIQTDRLFGVLGALSPSEELLEFMKARSLHAVLLINASKDLSNQWLLRGQLFRAANRSRTPVVESIGSSLDEVSSRLAKRIFMYVNPEGQIIESQELNFLDRTQAPKPIYKKWWFWTAVGVGLAGVGTGSYFLFKPEDQVRFQVKHGGVN